MQWWIVFTCFGFILIVLFVLGCLRVSRIMEDAERRDVDHAER